jgi:hypothetical protein
MQREFWTADDNHKLAHRPVFEVSSELHEVADHCLENDLAFFLGGKRRVAINAGFRRARPMIHHADWAGVG